MLCGAEVKVGDKTHVCLLERNHEGSHQSKNLYAWKGKEIITEPRSGGPSWSPKHKAYPIPKITRLEEYQ